jgi:hypothetical protein
MGSSRSRSARGGDVASTGRLPPSVRAAVLAVTLAAIVALYAYPVVALWNATGRTIPAWTSSDSYLYLGLSRLTADARGNVRNPWYGNEFPAGEGIYLRFGAALRFFRALSASIGSEGAALIAWHVLVILAIGLCLLAFLRHIDGSLGFLVPALLALMLLSGNALHDLKFLTGRESDWFFGLPFARAFYPQSAVPMMFGSFAAIVRWLETRSISWLAVVPPLQFIAFVVFPYATVIILAVLIVSAAGARLVGVIDGRDLVRVALAALVALLADLAWLLTGGALHLPSDYPLTFDFDPSRLPHGRRVWEPMFLSGLLMFMSGVPLAARLVVVSFVAGAVLIQVIEATFPPILQMASHVGYFSDLVKSLPRVALAGAALSYMRSWSPRAARVGSGLAAVALTCFGIAVSHGTVTTWKDYNEANGELARALGRLRLSDRDVVVAPIHGFKSNRSPKYWEASWVPLISRARVLYSSSAVFLVQNIAEHVDRRAAYVFLTGETSSSIRRLLEAPLPNTNEQAFLADHRRMLFLYTRHRAKVLADIRHELEPRLVALERGIMPAALADADRVIVADYLDAPVFSADRVARLLRAQTSRTEGRWRITVAAPSGQSYR